MSLKHNRELIKSPKLQTIKLSSRNTFFTIAQYLILYYCPKPFKRFWITNVGIQLLISKELPHIYIHTLSACCGSTIRLVLIYSHSKRVRGWVFTEAASIQQQEDSARLWFHSFLWAAHWNIDHALWTEPLPRPLIPASYSIHVKY